MANSAKAAVRQQNLIRFLAVLLIICTSIAVGVGVNLIWNTVDEGTHPRKYREIVSQYASEYNVPEYIIFAVIKVESDFDPLAESSKGARGLMQMMPSTFEWLTGDEHLQENLNKKSLNKPDVSIRYGTYYLCYLYRKFDYNWNTALAAYNAGEGNVANWLKNSEYTDENGNLTQIPFSETKAYVSKVNDAMSMYKKLYYENNEIQ